MAASDSDRTAPEEVDASPSSALSHPSPSLPIENQPVANGIDPLAAEALGAEPLGTEISVRSQLEPELGGALRDATNRSGLEPELGGQLRQRGVYVDELTCIGCTHCVYVARNTFYIEEDHGRARVFRQNGDSEDLIQEAIDTCPVDCIHWLDYTELKQKEIDRRYQVIPVAGFPVSKALIARQQRQARDKGKRRPKGKA